MKLDFLEKRLSLAQRRPLIANLYPLPPREGGAPSWKFMVGV